MPPPVPDPEARCDAMICQLLKQDRTVSGRVQHRRPLTHAGQLPPKISESTRLYLST